MYASEEYLDMENERFTFGLVDAEELKANFQPEKSTARIHFKHSAHKGSPLYIYDLHIYDLRHRP